MIRNLAASAGMLLAISAPALAYEAGSEAALVEKETVISPEKLAPERSMAIAAPFHLAQATDATDLEAPHEMEEEAIGQPGYADPSVPAGVTEDAATREDVLGAEEEFHTQTGDLEPGEPLATTDGPLPEQTSTERAEEILLEDEEINQWKQPEGRMQKGSAVEEHIEQREQLDGDKDFSLGDEPMNTLED